MRFYSVQYELAFRPTKLCNWEAVKKPSVLPKRRGGATKIIANDRGHLLPVIRKLNPWTSTCMPTQLALKTCNRLEHSCRFENTYSYRVSAYNSYAYNARNSLLTNI